MKTVDRKPSKEDIIGRFLALFIFFAGFAPAYFNIGSDGLQVITPISTISITIFLLVFYNDNTGEIKQ